MIITEQVIAGQKLIKNVFSSHFLMLLRWKKVLPRKLNKVLPMQISPKLPMAFFIEKPTKPQILMNAKWNIWNTNNCSFEAKLKFEHKLYYIRKGHWIASIHPFLFSLQPGLYFNRIWLSYRHSCGFCFVFLVGGRGG